MFVVDTESAIERLMRFLSVEGVTGREAKIGKELVAALKEAGVPARSIRFDDAHTRIPLPTETGNLIVELPGRGALESAERLLFMTHMDTVPLCAGAKPKRQGKKIVNAAKAALGGDNRTGCAVLVTLAAELLRQKPDHPAADTALHGARGERAVGRQACTPGGPRRRQDGLQLRRPGGGRRRHRRRRRGPLGGRDRWKASHAGGAPERGITATMVLAEALAAVRAGGWFGKVEKNGRTGTSNVGPVGGVNDGPAGDATNVVTDYVLVRGESRSHDAKFFREITAAYKAAFNEAAAKVTNSEGKAGRVKFTTRTDYHPFRLKETAPVVRRAVAAVAAQGHAANVRVTNGGLDANWMVRHGIPTVTFGAGQNEVHTVEEWINLAEFESACRLAVELATRAA